MENALIAEAAFDLAYTQDKMWVRVYPPERDAGSVDWSCRFEIDAPISVTRAIFGVSGVQALVLALKTMAAYLYGSEVYQRGELGVHGEFGGDLGV